MRYSCARIEGQGTRGRDIGSTAPRRRFGDAVDPWNAVALTGLNAELFRFGDDIPAGRYQVEYMTGAVRFYDHPAGTHKWMAASWQTRIVTRITHSGGDDYEDFTHDTRADDPHGAMARGRGATVEFDHGGGWIGAQFLDSRLDPTLYTDNRTFLPLEFRLVAL